MGYKQRRPIPVSEGGTSLTTITSHNLIIGNGTGTPALVAPSATSGVPVISQGAAADPVYGTAVVAGGGTGVTSTTAYAVICGGTTSTNPLQSIASVGTSGQVLTSNGAGALPTFQTTTAVTGSIIGTSRCATLNSSANAIFHTPSDTTGTVTAADAASWPVSMNGTIDRLNVYLTANASTVNTTVTVRKNNVDTALTTTLTASTTGLFTDLVNSVSFSSGDRLSFSCSQGATGATSGSITVRFTPS